MMNTKNTKKVPSLIGKFLEATKTYLTLKKSYFLRAPFLKISV